MPDTTPQAPETASQPPSLGLADIAFLLQIVEICSQRGAFKADELSSIGQVYDKVKGFLNANVPAQPDAPAEGTAQ